jgi:hypothetical protein
VCSNVNLLLSLCLLGYKSMAVIMRTLTTEGIVLAADGRCSGAVDGTVFGDSTQKIFPIKTPTGAFAYTISGAVEIIADGGREIAVDIAAEIRKSTEHLAKKPARSLENYAVRFCRPICRALNDAQGSGRFSIYPSPEPSIYGERGNTITRINVDGFRDGYPSSVAIRLFHENNSLGEPEISPPSRYLASPPRNPCVRVANDWASSRQGRKEHG